MDREVEVNPIQEAILDRAVKVASGWVSTESPPDRLTYLQQVARDITQYAIIKTSDPFIGIEVAPKVSFPRTTEEANKIGGVVAFLFEDSKRIHRDLVGAKVDGDNKNQILLGEALKLRRILLSLKKGEPSPERDYFRDKFTAFYVDSVSKVKQIDERYSASGILKRIPDYLYDDICRIGHGVLHSHFEETDSLHLRPGQLETIDWTRTQRGGLMWDLLRQGISFIDPVCSALLDKDLNTRPWQLETIQRYVKDLRNSYWEACKEFQGTDRDNREEDYDNYMGRQRELLDRERDYWKYYDEVMGNNIIFRIRDDQTRIKTPRARNYNLDKIEDLREIEDELIKKGATPL